jgi:ferrochelatase
VKTAVILMNLGTPEAPTAASIRRYLREFLSDRRVVEIPRPLWWPILHGPILMLRPRRLVPAYRLLWEHHGDSPLRLITARQVSALQALLSARGEAAPQVTQAMTYGRPSLAQAVDDLQRSGVRHVLVLPLYPQYSGTTTGAIYDQVAALMQSRRDVPSISVVKHYHTHPLYIEALAQSVERSWQRNGRSLRLLLSFHGIPQRNVRCGDPYERQCRATAQALTARLGLAADCWRVSFQSRLGRAEWLQPYTSDTLRQWGSEKLASVDVVCPAFAADCLETLEEIAVENRTVFQRAGGGEYHFIQCLNDDAAHIEMLAAIVNEQMPSIVSGSD